MMSKFGNQVQVSIFGGSHEDFIGATIEGLPINTAFDMKELQDFLHRRAPGNSPFATPRKEPDIAVIEKGCSLFDGIAITTDPSFTMKIQNTNQRSGDYKELADIPRPGHADYTAYVKYGRSINMAGGGPFSARMTAPLCIAGGIAIQLLRKHGIKIHSHLYSVGTACDIPFDPIHIQPVIVGDLPVIDPEAGESMKQQILEAKKSGDSIGGVVEVCATGCAPGLGGPMYDGMESLLSPIFFGIPAVKGIEFGAGFSAASMRGSAHNDPFIMGADGSIETATNHHGGILGGITTGMPLTVRAALKPTPSIAKEQDSISLSKQTAQKLSVKGRHDPCVAVRAVPVMEAALAIGLLDAIMI